MEPRAVEFKNRGMFQDTSISKANNEFAFENHNIRITSVNDNTLLSVTNEKGPARVNAVIENDLKPCYIKYFPTHLEAEFPVMSDVSVTVEYYVAQDPEKTPQTFKAIISKGSIASSLSSKKYIVPTGYTIDVPEGKKYLIDDVFVYYKYGEPLPEVSPVLSSKIEGVYLGHAILGKYLVLFTKGDKDYIYRLTLPNDRFSIKQLFSGDLNFSVDNPIEALPYYENENVQKVYWVDGRNQPRVINIMADSDYSKYQTQFDFSPSVSAFPAVKISKNFYGNGKFPAGTIQYFITYYNKFGAETGIIWNSSLHYIAPVNRGARADETVNCSFTIDITNFDKSYDYIRIYSVKRSSLNGPIEVNIVADNYIKTIDSLSIVDNNYNQESIDPNLILFLTGQSFVASTIEQKDGTLFLGNVDISGTDISSEMKWSIEQTRRQENTGGGNITGNSMLKVNTKCFAGVDNGSFYSYQPEIINSSKYFKTFKSGEIYRFAIQFQNKSGEWTSPIWVGDKYCSAVPSIDTATNQVNVPNISFEWSSFLRIDPQYVNYRLLMAETSPATRSIAAQGVLCPTVFNYEERNNNQPYAVSSWIMRPRQSPHCEHLSDVGSNREDNAEIQCIQESFPPILTPEDSNVRSFVIIMGFTFGHKLDWKLYTTSKTDIDSVTAEDLIEKKDGAYYNCGRWIDCYNKMCDTLLRKWAIDVRSFLSEGTFEGLAKRNINSDRWRREGFGKVTTGKNRPARSTTVTITKANNISLDIQKKKNNYYVDSSIVTFHSPDIIDNPLLVDNRNLDLRIVGIVPIDSVMSDIDLTTETNGLSPSACFLHEGVGYTKGNTDTLTAGLFYQDSCWKFVGSNIDVETAKLCKYKVYLWNKQGAINGYTSDVKTAVSETPAVLKHKIMANERFASTTQFLTNPWTSTISKVVMFNSDELELKQIDAKYKRLYYYGNYDKLLVPNRDYYIMSDNTTPYSISGAAGTRVEVDHSIDFAVAQKDPIRIKYKSTPHAVFSLSSGESAVNLLPYGRHEHGFDLEDMYEIGEGEYPEREYSWEATEFGENNLMTETFAGIYPFYYGEPTFNGSDTAIRDYVISHFLNTGTEQKTVLYCLCTDKVDTAPKTMLRYYRLTSSSSGAVVSEFGGFLETNGRYYVHPTEEEMGATFYNLPSRYISISGNTFSYSSKPNFSQYQINEIVTTKPYLFLAELYTRIPYNTLYGGTDQNALEKLRWIPISDPTKVGENIEKTEGDTYFQRWDCLKTYPFTEEDENSVVDVTSFMLETHINLDGRYDVNRGSADILNIRPSNFNLMNNVYSQENNLFVYNVLDEKYDLSTVNNEIVWSLPKSSLEDIDTWTNINLLNSLTLDGSYGAIERIENFNNILMVFQDKAISSINYNNRIQVSTGQGVPIEIANSGKVDGYTYATTSIGCRNKWSLCKTPSGIYFIDSETKALYKISNEGIVNISNGAGMTQWFKDNVDSTVWKPNGTGFRLNYDAITNDLYIANDKTCLLYSEPLRAFTSFMPYENKPVLFNFEGSSFIMNNSTEVEIYKMFAGGYNRSFNDSMIGYSMTYRVNPEPFEDKLFSNIEFIADCTDPSKKVDESMILDKTMPFTKIKAWNEYQYGEKKLETGYYPSNLKKKFRLWRADIPRDQNSKYGLDRMRNPWISLTLGKDVPDNKKMVFHNLIVKYYK